MPPLVIKIFTTIKRRWRLCLAGGLVLTVFAGGVRLAQGPVRIDGLRHLIVTRLERNLPGSEASLKHLDLVWFHDANALGLRLEDVVLKDAQKRVIASSGSLEAALALDSLLMLHLAPARLTAEDFHIVLSVSPEGSYELGHEASGDPGALAVDTLFEDLTGPEKLGRPVSFTRRFSLTDGTVSLRQVGTDLDWRAEVARIDFTKTGKDLRAEIGLAVNSGGQWAFLNAKAASKIRLEQAQLDAEIKNMVPADIFPSVGLTRPLSALDARVDGAGHITYSAANGIEKASLDITAGEGSYDFGTTRQPFESIVASADYLPAQKAMDFSAFRLKTRHIDTDLRGTVRLEPENHNTGTPYRVAFDFTGPRVSGHLAEDFPVQTLSDVHFIGAFIPEQRRLEILSGRGRLKDAPLRTRGTVYTDAEGRIGADLTAQIEGDFGKDMVFAFWPEDLTPILRKDLIGRIGGGVYSNADFVLKAPPGSLRTGGLSDEHMTLSFDYADMSLKVHDHLPTAEKLHGKGLLRGNSFDLSIDGGRMGLLPVTGGELTVESFQRADKGRTHVRINSRASVADAVETVDPLTEGELSQKGLTRERLSGEADIRVDIGFVSFVTPLSYDVMDIRFTADMHDAGLKQAALGWDMTHAQLKLEGDMRADRIEARGPADVGPYRGEIGYRTGFETTKAFVDFNGSFNARPFGGSPTRRVNLKGALEIADNIGTGTIASDIFNGRLDWSGTDARPNRVSLDGDTLSAGMKGQGLPIFARFRPEIPTQIDLIRAGDVWSGQVQAEGFTGELAYVEGRNPRLVYNALITPERARLLGVGALPIFNHPRRLSVNIGLDGQSREALIRLDTINAVLGWSETDTVGEPTRTLTATLSPHDLHLLGLPEGWFTAENEIDVRAAWEQDRRGIRGQVRLDHTQVVRFDLPDMDSLILTDQPQHWARISADIDAGFLDRLGYRPHTLAVDGRVGTVLSLYQTANTSEGAIAPGDISAAVLNLDVAAAELRLARSDWVKPKGEPGQLAFSFDEGGPEGGVNMTRIHAAGERFAIEGRAAFAPDGDLDFADLSRFWLKDVAQASIQVYQVDEPQTRIISVKGELLDMRPWIDPPGKPNGRTSRPPAPAVEAPEPTAPAPQPPTRILFTLDRLRLAGEGAFTRVDLEGEWDGRNRLNGQGTALTDNGNLISFRIWPDTDLSRFLFTADDAANLVYTATGDQRLRSGTLIMQGAYRDGQMDAVLRGEDIRVSRIPLLGQLLTLASLQGLSDTLTGDGIGFEAYEFPVRYRDGFVFIRDGWAKGDALRINVTGATDTKTHTLDYSGTLIPAYGINAAFAGIPLIGDLLTSKREEGVLGIKYRLRGYTDAPQAEINPLSLVLPGFFRRVLDRDQPDMLPPIEEEK